MEARRFISEAADVLTPIAFASAVGPPKLLKTSSTVFMPRLYTKHVHDVNMNYVYTLCDYKPMETMGDRLKWARQKAGFRSARAAALKHGWKVSTYSAHENGQNEYGEDEAKGYGKAFKRSPGWLLTGIGDAIGTKKTKLVGKVGAGSVVYPLEGDETEVDLAPGAPPDAVAVTVDGDSMFPRYFHGEKLFYTRNGASPAELIGKECVIQLKDGGMLVKILRRGTKPKRFNLESWNAPTLIDQIVDWAAPVRWTERG
jgi:phage repressor protein C with HTH and peptisase S24 domain